MNRRNKYHILRQNHKLNMQDNFIFFDTETSIIKKDNTEIQNLKLGWALHSNNGGYKWLYFDKAIKFWDFVEENTCGNLIIYAHNVDFDFKIVDGYREMLIKRRWNLRNIYVKGCVFMMSLERNGQTIHIWDTMNYFPQSLEKIGAALGIPKMSIDFNKCSHEELSLYCKNDVYIIYELIKKLISFLSVHDLSRLRPTAGSIAFNCFKHKFYTDDVPIHIHAHPGAIALERRSYRGGITDCFYIGKTMEKLYKLDINSMYPFIMKKYESPIKLIHYDRFPKKVELKKLMQKYHVIIDADIDLPMDSAYILTTQKCSGMPKSVFLHGCFRVALSTPEIEYVLKHGKILNVREIAVYEKRNIFSDYVDFFYNKRVEYKDNKSFNMFCKLMLNTLYGKFGQKQTDLTEYRKGAPYDIAKYHIVEADNEYILIHLGNTILQQKNNDSNSFDGFVAVSSLITAYARMYLIDLIRLCGRDNLYYCDTDSMIVNENGFKRLKTLIDPVKLGFLKLEETSVESEFIRPKFYSFNGVSKCKGVKKGASIISDSADEMVIEQKQFMRFKTALKEREVARQIVKSIRKRISKSYDKGLVMGGRVVPFSIDELNALDALKYGQSEFDKTIPVADVAFIDSSLEPGENTDNYHNIRI
jgi:hypothetical protein